MPKLETPRELAIRLFQENNEEIARGVHKLVTRLNPRWADIDREAFTHNGATLLTAVQHYMQSGDVDTLFKLARDLMRVRKLAGFTGTDFNVVMHTYMPVVRKAFIARAPTVRQGLAAFDAAEAVLLPLITRLVEAVARVDEITTPDSQPAFHGRPFEAVSVDEQVPEFLREMSSAEEDDEEVTNPDARAPPAGRRRS